MKRKGFLLLIGLICLSVSTVAPAHQRGHGGGSYGPHGGVSVWGDSWGNYGWTGSLNYGWSSGPYRGHVHGPACGYAPRHRGAWGKGYRKGFKHGYRAGHHGHRGHRGHHGPGRGHH